METLANKMITAFIAHGNIQERERDIYEYGAIVTISLLTNFAITLALGFIFAKPLELLALFLPFIALRTTSGGYHAKTFWGCVIASAVSITVTLLCVSFCPPAIMLAVTLVLTAFSVIVTFVFAPVEHPNRPFEQSEIVRFRSYSRIVAIICSTAVCLFLILQAVHISFSIALGLALSGLSTVVSIKIQRQIRRKA